jgi:hypothetical protein
MTDVVTQRALVTALILVTIGCAGPQRVRGVSRGRDRADLQVLSDALIEDLFKALNAALGREGGEVDDCVLEIWRTDPGDAADAAIHISAGKVDLHATPICGPHAATTIRLITRGAVFYTPWFGPIYLTERPLDAYLAKERPEALSHEVAMANVATWARAQLAAPQWPRHPVVLFEAATTLDVSSVLGDVRAIVATGVGVMLYASTPPDNNSNEGKEGVRR